MGHRLATVSALLVCALGCASSGPPKTNADNFGWTERGDAYVRPGEGGFSVRWSRQLTDRNEARYLPVEMSGAAFDKKRKRIYVGTTEGNMFAFDLDGRRRFFYDAGAQVESRPAVDMKTGEFYFPSVDGTVHAVMPNGTAKWRTKLIGSVRTTPVLTADALYVVGELDEVTALARDDGRILWTYSKQIVDEITIAGHSGILLENGRLYVGFTDGAVAALNPGDGRVEWELETALDVDTTPVLVRGTLFIASFTAGLYALNPDNGTVIWRDATFLGVTGLAGAGRMLVISSARRGISLLDLRSRLVVWEKAPERGAPTAPVVTETGTVIYGETQGSLLSLALSDGREIARAEGGHGFSATPAVLGQLGGAMSNGGRFLFLRIN